ALPEGGSRREVREYQEIWTSIVGDVICGEIRGERVSACMLDWFLIATDNRSGPPQVIGGNKSGGQELKTEHEQRVQYNRTALFYSNGAIRIHCGVVITIVIRLSCKLVVNPEWRHGEKQNWPGNISAAECFDLLDAYDDTKDIKIRKYVGREVEHATMGNDSPSASRVLTEA
ncbi:hypothetical protein J6590_048960, partial [Homalodisca vitripennis]